MVSDAWSPDPTIGCQLCVLALMMYVLPSLMVDIKATESSITQKTHPWACLGGNIQINLTVGKTHPEWGSTSPCIRAPDSSTRRKLACYALPSMGNWVPLICEPKWLVPATEEVTNPLGLPHRAGTTMSAIQMLLRYQRVSPPVSWLTVSRRTCGKWLHWAQQTLEHPCLLMLNILLYQAFPTRSVLKILSFSIMM